ncbi:glutamate ligase domain-containing protein [Streptomyces sp. NPDC050416]|uniref:glutamate ligase domain-containing protein n=1 Tax=Streptomyces sp. NPDC050416 TaxID=3365611 RepID=UPI0037A6CB92
MRGLTRRRREGRSAARTCRRIVPARQASKLCRAFNAAPEAVRASPTALAAMANGRDTIAVLGGMHKLGDASKEAHAEIGRMVAELGISALIVVGGPEAPWLEEGARWLEESARSHGADSVLVPSRQQARKSLWSPATWSCSRGRGTPARNSWPRNCGTTPRHRLSRPWVELSALRSSAGWDRSRQRHRGQDLSFGSRRRRGVWHAHLRRCRRLLTPFWRGPGVRRRVGRSSVVV